jgi:hypothetical protein
MILDLIVDFINEIPDFKTWFLNKVDSKLQNSNIINSVFNYYEKLETKEKEKFDKTPFKVLDYEDRPLIKNFLKSKGIIKTC